ncbi:hypothetical protein GS928_23810 [Rhodococcus hoagii]|nr:hypothetical protein [Prescottella equi]
MYDVVLPMHISSTAELDWLSVWSMWRRAFDFDRKAYLVATSDSGVRRLGVQLLETPPFRPKNDPGPNEYAPMPMRLRAGWPFWVEEDTVDVFKSTATSPLVVWDGAAYYSGTVVVSNPTNQPSYLKWIVETPTGGKVALPDFSWESDPEHEDYEFRNRLVHFPTLGTGSGWSSTRTPTTTRTRRISTHCSSAGWAASSSSSRCRRTHRRPRSRSESTSPASRSWSGSPGTGAPSQEVSSRADRSRSHQPTPA